MRRIYLTVLTIEIETEGFGYIEDHPERFQNDAATYIGGVVQKGVTDEDSRDKVLDVRTYALGVCIGKDNAEHAPVLQMTLDSRHVPGDVPRPVIAYWCKTCGAFKYGHDSAWELPEIRIDRKET